MAVFVCQVLRDIYAALFNGTGMKSAVCLPVQETDESKIEFTQHQHPLVPGLNIGTAQERHNYVPKKNCMKSLLKPFTIFEITGQFFPWELNLCLGPI